MAGKSPGLRLIRPHWPAPVGVTALSTTRHGGCSGGPCASLNLADHVGDDPRQVQRNRVLLNESAELPQPPHWLRQVHGTTVVDIGPASMAPEADAAISFATGGVCVVQTADCVPVLMCCDDGSGVAAVHAGWRGLAAGVIEAAVQVFRDHGIVADQLMAWLGPAISAAAYEVGTEIRDQFLAVDSSLATAFNDGSNGRWQLDLYAAARLRLSAAGVGRIFGGQYCTFNDRTDGLPTFFSHRRDGRCGRQATLIWRR